MSGKATAVGKLPGVTRSVLFKIRVSWLSLHSVIFNFCSTVLNFRFKWTPSNFAPSFNVSHPPLYYFAPSYNVSHPPLYYFAPSYNVSHPPLYYFAPSYNVSHPPLYYLRLLGIVSRYVQHTPEVRPLPYSYHGQNRMSPAVQYTKVTGAYQYNGTNVQQECLLYTVFNDCISCVGVWASWYVSPGHTGCNDA